MAACQSRCIPSGSEMPSLRIAVLLPAVLLAGCSSLATPYVRPTLPNAPVWTDQQGASNPAAAGQWWRSFSDSKLDQLVETVLANNNDLLAASLRVRKALLQADQAGVARLPVLNGSGTAQNTTPLADTSSSSNSFNTGLGAS